MSVQQIGPNFYPQNNSSSAMSPSVSNNGLKQFTTLEYTNKNDGKTYIAKKIILNQNGKTLEGIYVFDKAAKPDQTGNIQGEFMSYETFMKKMASELPSVNSKTMQAYNSNINVATPEEKFDNALNSGVKLSDGSILLQPTMLNTGMTEIKPANGSGYNVIFTSFVGGYKHAPSARFITETQLLQDKGLCAGTIQKINDNDFKVTYYINSNFNDYSTETKIMNKQECAKFLESKFIHF